MIAMIYHQLGRIAQEQHDFATAEKRCLQSLEIKKEQKDEYSTAMTCHQLGIITEEQRDFIEAEKWYKRALVICEKQNYQLLAASSYAQLGRMNGKMVQRIEAGHWLLKAIQNFSGNRDRYNTVRAIRDYFDNLYAADQETRILLRANWQKSEVDQLVPFIQKVNNIFHEMIERFHHANILQFNIKTIIR
ncbi:MAG: hypothetical protein D3910_22385 [Candidatus Electrothrix sp. ATG2]|nr:hypothetical protein [Candidatus Electrothrix sp. ATG2]